MNGRLQQISQSYHTLCTFRQQCKVSERLLACALIIQSYVQMCSNPPPQLRTCATVNFVVLTISFEAYLNSTLPISFKPSVTKVTLSPGEVIKADYFLSNNSQLPITGEAVYTVTPFWASKHFIKLECFCFKRIMLNCGSKVVLPLVCFVDPRIKLETTFVNSLTLTYFMNLNHPKSPKC
ncbi:MAG: cytochrome c oxidase assembly protein [Candidatus Hodgkinia cicadicola]